VDTMHLLPNPTRQGASIYSALNMEADFACLFFYFNIAESYFQQRKIHMVNFPHELKYVSERDLPLHVLDGVVILMVTGSKYRDLCCNEYSLVS